MNHQTTWLFLSLLLFGFSNGYGQTFIVEGIIKDSDTNQPIIGAGIILKNSSRGTARGSVR